MKTWYSVHLSHQGEKESSKSIIRTVKSALGKGSEAYIPCVRGEGPGYRQEFYLVEGYVFVTYKGNKLRSLMALEDDPFFDSIVTFKDKKGRRQPQPISDREIEEMRQRVRDELENPDGVEEGDDVYVIDGDCRYLEGVVKSVKGVMATVHFDFFSKTKKAKIPLFCLKKLVG